jgi:hypothetical protein
VIFRRPLHQLPTTLALRGCCNVTRHWKDHF